MRRWSIVAAIVTGLCLAGAGPAWATFPGRNGKIAYTSSRPDFTGPTIIHTIRPDGTDDQALVGGDSPSWSSDGQRITFARGVDEIFTMRADGSDVHRVTHTSEEEFAPVFSPNGRRIAFTASENPLAEMTAIVSVRVDGSDKRVLAKGVNRPGWALYFPDGRHIAYGTDPSQGLPHVWTMSADGSHKRRLTAGAPLDVSPDGRHILFLAPNGGGISTMHPDGSQVRHFPWCGGAPGYSPDDRRVAWVGTTDPSSAIRNVFTGTLGCAGIMQVTHYRPAGNHTAAGGPAWQPLP